MTQKDEQIGFHNGSLTTLVKERQEFLKMINLIDQLIQAHMKSLKDLGVDLQKESKKSKLDDKLK